MKKRGLLVVLLAVVLATAGVVYAHWTASLNVSADVTTGNIAMAWTAYGTDDDGVPGNDLSGNDNNSDVPPGHYDGHGTASSDDPSESGQNGYYEPVNPLVRYDKDVGICTVAPSANPNELVITIDDAYPSYHCTVYASYTNSGSVPVKTTSYAVQEYRGGVALVFPDMLYNTELASAYSSIDYCGTQIDPGGSQVIAIGFHLLQGAAPGAHYHITWTTGVVNWNDWDESMCTYAINGYQFP